MTLRSLCLCGVSHDPELQSAALLAIATWCAPTPTPTPNPNPNPSPNPNPYPPTLALALALTLTRALTLTPTRCESPSAQGAVVAGGGVAVLLRALRLPALQAQHLAYA